MTTEQPKASSFASGAGRIFELSLGEMLWSRRTIFMVLVVLGPVFLALVARVMQSSGIAPLRVNGARVAGIDAFSVMIWGVYLRFIVPVLGVFYGTSLIADEVEDRTLTYLFVRPVRRSAVLLGKYLACVACTVLVVLPSMVIVYFLAVPLSEIAASFRWFAADLGLVAAGLAVYAALFALVGVVLKRPLIVGLVYVFGWELLTLFVPGYLKRFTVAYHLQALVPHDRPSGGVLTLLQSVFVDTASTAVSVTALAAVLVAALVLAARIVERREYLLDQ